MSLAFPLQKGDFLSCTSHEEYRKGIHKRFNIALQFYTSINDKNVVNQTDALYF